MASESDPDLSGDLLELHDWWIERSPERPRSTTWIVDPTSADDATEQVNRAVDSGATLIALNIGPSSAAARATIAFIAGIPATGVIDQPPDMTDERWMQVVADIRDELAVMRQPVIGVEKSDVSGDDSDVAIATAALLAAAARDTAVLFDGLVCHAGAVVGLRETPDAAWWWKPATSSQDPAIQAAQEQLRSTPATHFATRGNGTAAIAGVLALLDVVDPI